ncbi:MAG TPA: hypothetical protein VNO30_50585 [Kofleriaceae bacterium]|nr:hypothetical protein [Kofleriaceae bacterium]
MSTPIATLTAEEREQLARWEERPLPPDEFAARVAVPMSDYERESFEDMVSWFTRRYPTAGDRMRAIRIRMRRLRRRTA